jgi:glyoxylase-like metal-dependent hydrolase (beta-lactamase superfamily II)
MAAFICVTCGMQYAESADPPAHCRICVDERQYVGFGGQHWTTLDALAETHENHLDVEEPGLASIETRPSFAIGQRALLVQHPEGNVLWDCLSLVDQPSVDRVADLGGVRFIAISHPHFYGVCVDWSQAFGGIPVYINDADARWVCRPDPCVNFWAGETFPLADGLTLVRCGGHFEGGTILHWTAGADERGVLLTGDTVKVGMDRASVSVMRSYPNLIPVGPTALTRIEAMLEPLKYDRIYGAWMGHRLDRDAQAAVKRSIQRYRAAIAG